MRGHAARKTAFSFAPPARSDWALDCKEQTSESGAHGFNGGLHLRSFAQGEIVEHHDVARLQRRREHLLDVREKVELSSGPSNTLER